MTKPSISHAWRALRHRNFSLFASGQTASLIGTWMTRLATSFGRADLTHFYVESNELDAEGKPVPLPPKFDASTAKPTI